MEGLRERHKLKTRIALRDAALLRFVRDGFDATTVEDIAADVDVSPRTFFRYFPTKDAVAVAPYVELFEAWEALVRSAPAGRPLIAVLQDASHLITDAYEHDAEFWDRHHDAVVGDSNLGLRMLETQARLQQRAARALAERLGLDVQHDLRPRILAAAAMAAVGAAVAQWYAGGKRDDRRALVDAAYHEVAAAGKLLHKPLPQITGGSSEALES
jgi:AcrR family transcriptional regulator